MSFKFNNGDKVHDLVSGLTGIIVGQINYLSGYHLYLVKPRGGTESQWIKEQQLELIKAQAIQLPKKDREL